MSGDFDWPTTLRLFLLLAGGVVVAAAGLGLVLAPVVMLVREVVR